MVFVGIHVGQCGVQTGISFWKLVDDIGSTDEAATHGLLTSACSRPYTHKPLAVSVDVDSRPLKEWTRHKFSVLDANETACFHGQQRQGSGGNFASGLRGMQQRATGSVMTTSTQLIDSVMEGIRKQAEACTSQANFFLTHSLAGGTGSGGGGLILQHLRDTYGSARYIITLSIAPSAGGDVPCQAFNSVLAGTALQELSDCSLLLQNSPGGQTDCGKDHGEGYVLEDMNAIAARGLAGLLLPLGQVEPFWLPNRMADLVESVTPIPAFRFAELHVSKPDVGESRTMKAVAQSMCRDVPRYGSNGRLIGTRAALLIARGKISGFKESVCRGKSNDIAALRDLVQGHRGLLSDGPMLTARHYSRCPQALASATPHRGGRHRRSHLPQFSPPGALIYAANRSSVGDFWMSCVQQASLKLQSNAYVHWYEAAGLMKDDLINAVCCMQDTATAYRWWCH